MSLTVKIVKIGYPMCDADDKDQTKLTGILLHKINFFLCRFSNMCNTGGRFGSGPRLASKQNQIRTDRYQHDADP